MGYSTNVRRQPLNLGVGRVTVFQVMQRIYLVSREPKTGRGSYQHLIWKQTFLDRTSNTTRDNLRNHDFRNFHAQSHSDHVMFNTRYVLPSWEDCYDNWWNEGYRCGDGYCTGRSWCRYCPNSGTVIINVISRVFQMPCFKASDISFM